MLGRIVRACAALTLIAGISSPTLATMSVTGNPSADGWGASTGYSLDKGTYIRGGGNLGYDLYATSFKIQAGSPLLGGGWNIGDTVLAVGGIMNTKTPSGWGSDPVTGPVVNLNNVDNTAVLNAKFGTSPDPFNNVTKLGSWGTSTVAPSAGNGFGSSSGGNGGDGTILLRAGTTLTSNNSNAGQILMVQNAYRDTYNGASWTETELSNRSFGKIIFQLEDDGRMKSWETFLNTTLLDAVLDTLGQVRPDVIPEPGDRINMAFQRGTSSTQFTDALTVAAALPAVVPEPASLVAWASLLVLCGVFAARRSRAALVD